MGSTGYTSAREALIDAFLDDEFVDGFAVLYPDEEFYVFTCFNEEITIH